MNNACGVLTRRGLNRDLRQLCGIGRRILPVIGVALFLLAGPIAHAQTTAQLTGTVQDASGAVIPGATVTLTDQATGILRASSKRMHGDCMPFPRWCRVPTLSRSLRQVSRPGKPPESCCMPEMSSPSRRLR